MPDEPILAMTNPEWVAYWLGPDGICPGCNEQNAFCECGTDDA